MKINKFYRSKHNSNVMILIKKLTQNEEYYIIVADWWSCTSTPATDMNIQQEMYIRKSDLANWEEV